MDPYPRFPAKAGVRITVDDAGWRKLVPRVEAIAARAAAAAGVEASVVLTDDRTVRRMNARHRGRDMPTNVLSFDPPGPGLPGELVLALGTIRREAAECGTALADHLAHLVVHGALHLRGHDHHRAGEARLMEMTEARLLARIGIGNPRRPRAAAQS